MKKIYVLSTILLTAVLIGCTSIPEPSPKEYNLIYGIIECNFTSNALNWNISEKDNSKSGIQIKIQNRNTNKFYTLTTNSKGEFYRRGLPQGAYRIISAAKFIQLTDRPKSIPFEVDFVRTKLLFNFAAVDDYITNLGKIKIDILMNDISQYSYKIYMPDYIKAVMFFEEEHKDSAWLHYDIFNGEESITALNPNNNDI